MVAYSLGLQARLYGKTAKAMRSCTFASLSSQFSTQDACAMDYSASCVLVGSLFALWSLLHTSRITCLFGFCHRMISQGCMCICQSVSTRPCVPASPALLILGHHCHHAVPACRTSCLLLSVTSPTPRKLCAVSRCACCAVSNSLP